MKTNLAHMEQPLAPPKPLSIIEQAVDRIGYVQSQMAPLKQEEEQLKKVLRASGETVVEGELFRATISVAQPGQKTDWEQVARDISAKAGLTTKQFDKVVNSNTKPTEPGEARVSVKARKGV